jgi:hypothetical protein
MAEYPGGYLQIGNAHKMFAGQGHDGLDFRAHQRSAEHRHGALPVNHRRDPEFLIDIPRRTECRELCIPRCGSGGEQLPRIQHRRGECPEATHEGSTRPLQVESHDFSPLRPYFFTTAAMQLISTSDFPGSDATATVVRVGPPFGK